MSRPSLYAVRVDDPDSHPTYIGPLSQADVDDLGARLTEAGCSWEAGKLYAEDELPGLWLAITEDDKADYLRAWQDRIERMKARAKR